MALYSIVYSPTGGTKKVADILASAMAEKYETIDLISNKCFDLSFEKNDICIISVPSFGGRVPEDAVKKMKSIKASGTLAVLIAVFGNRAIDDTLLELSDVATTVGFKVIAASEAVAEHSLVRIFGAGRPNSEDAAELRVFAKKIQEKLDRGDVSSPSLPGNRPYKEFKASPMTPVVDDTCINCKVCAKECPTNAISTENIREVDAASCFSCMRCVSICPMNARSNSPDVTQALEKRLRDRCTEKKTNKLYI